MKLPQRLSADGGDDLGDQPRAVGESFFPPFQMADETPAPQFEGWAVLLLGRKVGSLHRVGLQVNELFGSVKGGAVAGEGIEMRRLGHGMPEPPEAIPPPMMLKFYRLEGINSS